MVSSHERKGRKDSEIFALYARRFDCVSKGDTLGWQRSTSLHGYVTGHERDPFLI